MKDEGGRMRKGIDESVQGAMPAIGRPASLAKRVNL
jgi:hypothetical protein